MADQRNENPTPEEALADAVQEDPSVAPPPEGESVPPAPEAQSAEEVSAEATPDAAPEEPDYRDLHLRAVAEMDNVRKRARRDVGAAEARGIAKLAREVVGPLDDFERALAAAETVDGGKDVVAGFRLVQQQLVAALGRAGIEQDLPTGEPFDPHRHEALSQRAEEGTAPGVVLDVWSPGYHHGETVIRAAKVVVSS